MNDQLYTRFPLDPLPLTHRERVLLENAEQVSVLIGALKAAGEEKTLSALSYWLRRSLNPWMQDALGGDE